MKISEAARSAGLSQKMVRYYEQIGLLPVAARTGGNYRDFTDDDVAQLRFIGRSRALGFDMEEIRQLLKLRQRDNKASAVRAVAQRHMALIDARLAEMQHLRQELAALIDACGASPENECPILEALSQEVPACTKKRLHEHKTTMQPTFATKRRDEA